MPKGKNVTKVMNRNGRYGRRCLGKGFYIDNDSHKTGLNNHDLIIAGSRGGKTGSIVYPQLKINYKEILFQKVIVAKLAHT